MPEKGEVILTRREAEAVKEFIEDCLIEEIRRDENVDSIAWLELMISAWRKCGGRYDDESDRDERRKEYKG